MSQNFIEKARLGRQMALRHLRYHRSTQYRERSVEIADTDFNNIFNLQDGSAGKSNVIYRFLPEQWSKVRTG